MTKRQWNKVGKLGTVNDMEMRIVQINAKEEKRGISEGEKSARDYCYSWIESYFTYEVA